jgi:hypothetical protein
MLTSFPRPLRAIDVAMASDASRRRPVMTAPRAGQVGQWGGELVSIDLATGRPSPLVARLDAGVSLVSPAWSSARWRILFERSDFSAPAVAYPRKVVARSRVDRARTLGWVCSPGSHRRRTLARDFVEWRPCVREIPGGRPHRER